MQRLLEKLNQNGVMYKPAAAAASGNNDADIEVDSFENGPPGKKRIRVQGWLWRSRAGDWFDIADEPVGNQNNDDEEVCFQLFVFIYLNYASSFS